MFVALTMALYDLCYACNLLQCVNILWVVPQKLTIPFQLFYELVTKWGFKLPWVDFLTKKEKIFSSSFILRALDNKLNTLPLILCLSVAVWLQDSQALPDIINCYTE